MKDTAASVLVRLKNQSKETGLNYQMCLQLFCQEEFLRKLSFSKYASNLVLKGGFFIYTLTEFESRPTRDVDFMIRYLSNELSNIEQVMMEICATSTNNDYIAIEVLDTYVITEDKEYHGVKTKFCGHIKNVRIPFSIDVGVDDVIVPGVTKRIIRSRLRGFEPLEIYTYSLESTISEKFDAILKRMELTSRMKDFFDIFYLSNIFDFDGRKLQEAIYQTINHRGTRYESDSFERIRAFKTNAFFRELWVNYELSLQMELPAFEETIDRLTVFIEPIFQAILRENEFFFQWSSEKQIWEKQSNLILTSG